MSFRQGFTPALPETNVKASSRRVSSISTTLGGERTSYIPLIRTVVEPTRSNPYQFACTFENAFPNDIEHKLRLLSKEFATHKHVDVLHAMELVTEKHHSLVKDIADFVVS